MRAVRIGKLTHPYLVSRHPGLDQRVADSVRSTVPEIAITSTGSIYSKLKGRVLNQVGRDPGDFVHLGRTNRGSASIEVDFAIGRPTRDNSCNTLIASSSLPALFTLQAGRSGLTGNSGNNNAPIACWTAFALHTGGAGTAGSSSRAKESWTLRSRVSGKSLFAGWTTRTNRTGCPGVTWSLSACRTSFTFLAGRTGRAGVSASANNNGARSTHRTHITPQTARTGGPGFTWRAAQRIARCASWAFWTLCAGRTGRSREAGWADKIGPVIRNPVLMGCGAGCGQYRDASKKHRSFHCFFL